MIKLEKIFKKYSGVSILENFDLSLKRGEIVVLIAPSGSGKTTLLNIISGIEDYDGGAIRKDISKIGYVFQEDRLLPWLSVRDNVSIVNKDKSRLDTILKKLKIDDYSEHFPKDLSGGMKQRVSIARAYNFGAELLLMDEAFKCLDLKLKNELLDDLIEDWSIENKTYLIATHDLAVASRLATRIIILSEKPMSIIRQIELDQKPHMRSSEEIKYIENTILGDENYEDEA